MKKLLLLALALLAGAHCLRAQNAATDESNELIVLENWRAGETVSPASVARFGIDRCFAVCAIDDATFARMEGRSFKADCPLPRTDLRYIKALHYDLDGAIRLGEMVCNRAIADDVAEILRTLYEARYPIGRMVLIDAYDADDERSMRDNNSSSFNFRFISGTKRISKHGKGMAVDINPLYNPCVSSRTGVTVIEPETGAPYVDRTQDFPCKIDKNDLCYKEFTRRGFTWGGDWTSLKDYQHFERDE